MLASLRLLPFCLLLISSSVRAQELPQSERTLASEEVEDEKADEKDAKKSPILRWSGRVFVGASATRIEAAGDPYWSNEQSVNSARAGLRYQHPIGLRAVIKTEFDDRGFELKDGYVRMKLSSAFRVTAGRFKKPISEIGLASKWDLPNIDRGLVDNVRVEGANVPFAGSRAEGIMLRYRAPTENKMGFYLALMQNDFATNIETRDASEDLTQDPYLRFFVEPTKGLHLASSLAVVAYQPEMLNVESFAHAPIGSLEAHYKSSGLLLWAEGFVGESVFAPLTGRASGRFLAARGIVAPRFRGMKKMRIEPFVGASYFDPRTTDSDNSNTEVQGGVNLAFTKFLRLQLEVSHRFAEGVFSEAEKTSILVQLASRFKE